MRAQLANDQLGGLTLAAQRACVCACVRVCGMSKYVEREGEPMCVCAVLPVRAVSGTVSCVLCVPAPRVLLVLCSKTTFR